MTIPQWITAVALGALFVFLALVLTGPPVSAHVASNVDGFQTGYVEGLAVCGIR